MLPIFVRDRDFTTPAGNNDRSIDPTRPRFLGALLSHPETLAVTVRDALDIPARNLYLNSIRKGAQPPPDPVLAAHLNYRK